MPRLIAYTDCIEDPRQPLNSYTGPAEIIVDGVHRENEIYRVEWFDDGTKRLFIYQLDANGNYQLNADETDVLKGVIDLPAEATIEVICKRN